MLEAAIKSTDDRKEVELTFDEEIGAGVVEDDFSFDGDDSGDFEDGLLSIRFLTATTMKNKEEIRNV